MSALSAVVDFPNVVVDGVTTFRDNLGRFGGEDDRELKDIVASVAVHAGASIIKAKIQRSGWCFASCDAREDW